MFVLTKIVCPPSVHIPSIWDPFTPKSTLLDLFGSVASNLDQSGLICRNMNQLAKLEKIAREGDLQTQQY